MQSTVQSVLKELRSTSRYVGRLYTELFYAAVPTSFSYFLPFCYTWEDSVCTHQLVLKPHPCIVVDG